MTDYMVTIRHPMLGTMIRTVRAGRATDAIAYCVETIGDSMNGDRVNLDGWMNNVPLTITVEFKLDRERAGVLEVGESAREFVSAYPPEFVKCGCGAPWSTHKPEGGPDTYRLWWERQPKILTCSHPCPVVCKREHPLPVCRACGGSGLQPDLKCFRCGGTGIE